MAKKNEEKGLKKLMDYEEKALESWLGKTKERLDLGRWLKKAREYENKGDYRKALDSYLKFIEIKLHLIRTQPKSTMDDYFELIKYYIKIAECYEKVKHLTTGGKIKDMEMAGEYYIKVAKMYLELEKYDDAYKNYENAARCYEEIGEHDKAANSYVQAAVMYYKLKRAVLASSSFMKAAKLYEKLGDYENASKAYLKYVELNLEIKDIHGAINGYKKIGECYDKLGNHKEAIQFYIKSTELSSQVGYYTDVAEKYEMIARSYERLGDYKNAIFYHLRAADQNLENDNLAASYNYENTARCYAKLEKYSETIDYYKKATQLRIDLNKYSEAAASSNEIAKYYEKINDLENATKFHFQYAELGLLGGQQNAIEGYKKAAELYETIAEKRIKENNYDKAIDDYSKATECYDRLNDKRTSANLYSKMAEIESNRNYDNAIKFYLDAAKRYTEVMDIINAARSYVLAKDYLNAAKSYENYAEMQLHMNQPFYAGNGYRKAADSYNKLKNLNSMKDNYNKSIHNYLAFLEKARYTKIKDETVNIGNANKNIGECYIELDDAPNAKKYLEQALDYCRKNKVEREALVTKALLDMVNANLSLKLGEYGEASKLLQNSLRLLGLTIKEGKWSDEYLKFLDHNKEKVKGLLEKIEAKPKIELVVEQPRKSFSQGRIKVVGKIINNSGYDINHISFLPSVPQPFEVPKAPDDIPELKSNKAQDFTLEMNIQSSGKFSFSPVEILYKDKNGNKYMKASNEILIEIK